jgi:hypothetical protein
MTKASTVSKYVLRTIKTMREAGEKIASTPRGGGSPEARLIHRQAQELRVLYVVNRIKEGVTQKNISEELELTPGRVSQIWNAHLKTLEQ